MFWRLRKRIREYYRSRFKVRNYGLAVRNVMTARYAYYFLAWSVVGLSLGHWLFVRRNPATGNYVIVLPADVRRWDLGDNDLFKVYSMTGSPLYAKPFLDDD